MLLPLEDAYALTVRWTVDLKRMLEQRGTEIVAGQWEYCAMCKGVLGQWMDHLEHPLIPPKKACTDDPKPPTEYEQYIQKWISCEKQLPAVNTPVVVYQHYLGVYLDMRIVHPLGGTTWQSWRGGEYCPPSHWMPLREDWCRGLMVLPLTRDPLYDYTRP